MFRIRRAPTFRFAALAAFGLLAASLAAASTPPANRAAASGRAGALSPSWQDWNQGLSEARRTQRPMVVDVYTDWCGWCRRMDRDVYANAAVREYLEKNFVTVKLNAERGTEAQYEGKRYTYATLAQRFRVTGYPVTIFLRSSGEHMANLPGYVPADRFLLLLRYVAEGYADRNVPFAEFEKQVQGAADPH
jgi:thioredoxin-related protein